MAKYKVGDELIVISDSTKELEKLRNLTKLSVDGDFAKFSWGLKIEDITYDKPYVILTYKTYNGEKQKVFAKCNDEANFNTEKVLEKALLKAFQNEIINITVTKNK